MDTKALIQKAAARFKHQESKHYLTEKYSSKLTIASQGGLWRITPEFLGFLLSYPNAIAHIVDVYGNVVKVNVPELLVEAHETYETTMRDWYNELEALKKSR